MKKTLSIILIIVMLICCMTSCGNESNTSDYQNISAFEQDLNEGADLTGKTVTFIVKDFVPNSAFGYNMQTGNHLNFCSSNNPGAKVGDTVTVKVTKVNSILGSYIIYYDYINIVKEVPSKTTNTQNTEFVGAYAGTNGSVIVLHNNGTGDYCWIGWDNINTEDITWTCENNMLNMESIIFNTTIVAEYTASNLSSPTTFSSDSSNWDDETFIKISNEDKSLTKPECASALINAYGDFTKPITSDHITFAIPVFYIQDESDNHSYAFGNIAKITYNSQYVENGIAKNNRESLLDNDIKNLIKTNSDSSQIFSSDKLFIKTYYWNNYSENVNMRAALIYDIPDKTYMRILYAYDHSYESLTGEFDKIVKSIYTDSVISEAKENNVSKEADQIKEPIKTNESNNTSGVSIELIEFLDKYEAFIDDYVAFIKDYTTNKNALSMINDYVDMLSDLTKFQQEVNQYDTKTMSTEDALYYTKVLLRCEEKLLSVM